MIREVNSKQTNVTIWIATILSRPKHKRKYLDFQGLEQFLIQLSIHIARKFYYKKRKSDTLIEIIERLFRRMDFEKEVLVFTENEVQLDLKNVNVVEIKKSLSPYKNRVESKVK